MSVLWNETVDVGWSSTRVLVESLSRADIARYAGASGDVNLVHIDEPFAQMAGHPSVIAHGMHTMGMAGTFLVSTVGHRALRRFSGRFLAPVLPGERLDCTITVSHLVEEPEAREVVLDLIITLGGGKVVFTGEAVAREPNEELFDPGHGLT